MGMNSPNNVNLNRINSRIGDRFFYPVYNSLNDKFGIKITNIKSSISIVSIYFKLWSLFVCNGYSLDIDLKYRSLLNQIAEGSKTNVLSSYNVSSNMHIHNKYILQYLKDIIERRVLKINWKYWKL